MDALPYRGRLDAEDLRHLRGRHVLEVSQDERIAIAIGQPCDDSAGFLCQRLTIEQFVGV
jgi:hypothetical protein